MPCPTTDDAARRCATGALRLGIAALTLSGVACIGPQEDDVRPEKRQPIDPALAEEWDDAMRDVGLAPVVPFTEDLHIGDVVALPAPPETTSKPGQLGLYGSSTSRWSALETLDDQDAESARRPAWGRDAETAPRVEQIVDIGTVTSVSLDSSDAGWIVPIEVGAMPGVPGPGEPVSVRVQAGTGIVESLSVSTVLGRLLEPPDGSGARRVSPEQRRFLPVAADPVTGLVYLVVVTEVLRVENLLASVRRTGARGEPAPTGDGGSVGAASILRANELNAALAASGAEDRIEGSIEFVAVEDDALTLRRSWSRPLAMAARGLVLEVEAATGAVLRTTPLGTELEFEVEEEDESAAVEDESAVVEERRRGAKKDDEPTLGEKWRARLRWDVGPRLDALRGKLSVFLGGRLHLDAAEFDDDDEITDDFGEPNPGVDARRAFLELGGVYGRYDFNFWVNFSELQILGDEPADFDYANFRNVFVGARNIPYIGGLRVGYFKEPFGLEETTSSNDITFLERSLTDAFIERRNLGVMTHRRFTDDRSVTSSVGIYREADDELDLGSAIGVTGRLTVEPLRTADERSVVHLGTALSLRWPGADGLRFNSRSSSALGQVLVDTGRFDAERELRWGLEFGGVSDAFSFQSETIVAASDSGSGFGDQVFWSSYLMGSYVLTGENRSYRHRVGAFGSVHPETPSWSPRHGAYELAGRYAYLDLDSGDIQGGRLHDWTLGLNWYANQNARVMLNYVVAHPEGSGYQQIIQARLQLTF